MVEEVRRGRGGSEVFSWYQRVGGGDEERCRVARGKCRVVIIKWR
jgi:hypothetical protein